MRNATFVACNLAKLASRKSTTIGEGLRGADGERVPPPDVVIADPARAGMDASLVATLRRVGAPRVVYVSCNPATQARDFRRLAGDEDDDDEKERAARYEVVSCAPVDMFPAHAARRDRRGASSGGRGGVRGSRSVRCVRIAQLLVLIDACVMFIAPRHVGFCAGGAAARVVGLSAAGLDAGARSIGSAVRLARDGAARSVSE